MKKELILPFLLIGIVFLSGCVGTPSEPQKPAGEGTTAETPKETIPEPTPEETKVVTIGSIEAYAENWDADPEVDGIKFYLEPKDKNDKLVRTNGTVDAILWESIYESWESLERVKGNLITQWSGVKLYEKDMGIFGYIVRLEYPSDYTPKKDDIGWLEVIFTTPDGKSFKAKDDYVFLGGW